MPGAMVRYGGMEAGKVDGVHVDPKTRPASRSTSVCAPTFP